MATPTQSRGSVEASESSGNGEGTSIGMSFSGEEITPLVIRGDQTFSSIEEAEEHSGVQFLQAVCDGASVDAAAKSVNLSPERINNLVSALQWIGLFISELETSKKALQALEDCETLTRAHALVKYNDPRIAGLMYVTKEDLEKCNSEQMRPHMVDKWAITLGNTSATLEITPRQRRKKPQLEIRLPEGASSDPTARDKRLKLINLTGD